MWPPFPGVVSLGPGTGGRSIDYSHARDYISQYVENLKMD